MEDYTYDFNGKNPKVLGAHMLEVCESIAAQKPSLEIHSLSIGGKADPVRLVFNVDSGPAINATLIDLGNRFRMIVNEVDVIQPEVPLSNLPVASAVWVPRPNLKVAAHGWILAGGAHHTGFSQSVTAQHLADFAEMAGMEFLVIGSDTDLAEFKNELKWNELYYLLAKGL
jgi:L-arabinose isomerase